MATYSMVVVFFAGLAAGAVLTGVMFGWSVKRGSAGAASDESRLEAACAQALAGDLQQQLAGEKQQASLLQERLTAAESARAAAEARLSATEQSAREQALLLERAKELSSDALSRVATEALAANSSAVFTMVEQKLSGLLAARTDQRWEEKRSAIDGLVKPLSETLANSQKETRELQGIRAT